AAPAHARLAQLRQQIAEQEDQLRRASGPVEKTRAQYARRDLASEYISVANEVEARDDDRLSVDEDRYFKTLRDEAIEAFAAMWDERVAVGPDGGTLATYKGWIYYRASGHSHYEKVVPGHSPQWYRATDERCGAGCVLERTWFYVFLEVGFDALSEIWLADVGGHYLGRVCAGALNINSSPVIAED